MIAKTNAEFFSQIHNLKLRGIYIDSTILMAIPPLIAEIKKTKYNTNADIYAKLIANMYSELITNDGFYRENSSEYQMYALYHLLPIFKKHKLINQYTDILAQKTSYFTSFLFIDKKNAFKFGDSDPCILASHAAKYYQKRKDGITIFPDSGIIFSQLDQGNDHICFINFYHNNGVHNHSDYCIFHLFN